MASLPGPESRLIALVIRHQRRCSLHFAELASNYSFGRATPKGRSIPSR